MIDPDKLVCLTIPAAMIMHASAPPDHKCADCEIDREPCPTCYYAWWTKRHPNTVQIGGFTGLSAQTVIAQHVLALRQLLGIWDKIKAGVGEFRGEMRAMDDAMDAVRIALPEPHVMPATAYAVRFVGNLTDVLLWELPKDVPGFATHMPVAFYRELFAGPTRTT
jgi:hypothetical protein